MAATFTIQLNNLRFFAKHGMYVEEAAVGNEFELNISLTVKAPKEKITSLEQTINYAEVYRIVTERFAVRKNLLETLAMRIADDLKEHFPAVKKTVVQISKLNPPITTFTGSVSVTYSKTYKV